MFSEEEIRDVLKLDVPSLFVRFMTAANKAEAENAAAEAENAALRERVKKLEVEVTDLNADYWTLHAHIMEEPKASIPSEPAPPKSSEMWLRVRETQRGVAGGGLERILTYGGEALICANDVNSADLREAPLDIVEYNEVIYDLKKRAEKDEARITEYKKLLDEAVEWLSTTAQIRNWLGWRDRVKAAQNGEVEG